MGKAGDRLGLESGEGSLLQGSASHFTQREGNAMDTQRLYSCDDHLDLWTLPADLWQARLPPALRERGAARRRRRATPTGGCATAR